MTFFEKMRNTNQRTVTENLASASCDLGSDFLNLFSICGSLRNREETEIEGLFLRAFNEEPLLTTRLAFYVRDIRKGLGERRTGRIFLKMLAKNHPDIIRKNLYSIMEYGRFDDVLELLDTEVKEDILKLIVQQLHEDIDSMQKGEAISLLGKWLPSINASSYQTKKKAKEIISYLGITQKRYRKLLKSLRAYSNVTEVHVSRNTFEFIRYNEVPSYAMLKHRNTFMNHDEKRFSAYVKAVKEGKERINASVLYPYDLVEKFLYQEEMDNEVLEEQWKALPNYIDDKEHRFLIMADVSGSMYGRPMATSIGLALYFAERVKGEFHNRFMTFSSRPQLVEIIGNTLAEKIRYIEKAEWEMNTNLEAAFELVLNTAIKHAVPQEELPTEIVVISDMEIDYCAYQKDWNFYEEMEERFKQAGYTIPNIIFWNVRSDKNTFLVDNLRPGVQLLSGHSATSFKNLIEAKGMSQKEFILSILDSERYQNIQI